MSKREPGLLLEDILEAAGKIKEYIDGLTFENFVSEQKTFDAVIRNFEIIGEAANRLPLDFKTKYSNVNWSRIIGFRNRIIHDYMGIDSSIVWEIIENNLGDLISDVKNILREI